MAKQVFINDDFIEEQKAVLHFKDLSFQRGYGIFDFFKLIGNESLFRRPLSPLLFISRRFALANRIFPTENKNIILELIKRNNVPGTGIRLGLTGGFSADGFKQGSRI